MTNHQLAIVFLLVVLAGLTAGAVWLLRRSPYTPSESVLFYIDVLLCRLLWRVDAPRSLPPGCENGAVIVANHRSSVDPFFIQVAAGRKVHWMVAAEYFAWPVAGRFLRKTGAIPTRRGGADTGAIRAAIRHAQNGELVGMFPEGRINLTEEFLLPVRPGAALVALRARAPMLPCYIEGAPYDGEKAWSPFFMRARVKVRFGQPIDLSEHYDAGHERELGKELTFRAMKEIARLAGREDYEPQLAGRKWMPDENGEVVENGEPEALPARDAENA